MVEVIIFRMKRLQALAWASTLQFDLFLYTWTVPCIAKCLQTELLDTCVGDLKKTVNYIFLIYV